MADTQDNSTTPSTSKVKEAVKAVEAMGLTDEEIGEVCASLFFRRLGKAFGEALGDMDDS